jgi:hypothetical protein
MASDFNKTVDPQTYAHAYKQYVDKMNSAYEALATHGMESPQFVEADKRAGEEWTKLRAMQGHKGAHWSA